MFLYQLGVIRLAVFSPENIDSEVRLAAFEWLKSREIEYGDVLPRQEIWGRSFFLTFCHLHIRLLVDLAVIAHKAPNPIVALI